MQYIIMGLLGYALLRLIRNIREADKEARREAESQRSAEEAAQMRAEFRRQQTESKRIVAEQIRQAKEQERLAKEQEKQATILAKHEEQLMKLRMRLTTAENEIAFNREQQERLWKLLEFERLECDASTLGSTTWQKHQRKVISLENQLHTVQKRKDKATMERDFCKQKLSA